MTNNTNKNNVENVNATGVVMGFEQHGKNIKILLKSDITAGRYVAGEVYEEWLSKDTEETATNVMNSIEGKGNNAICLEGRSITNYTRVYENVF